MKGVFKRCLSTLVIEKFSRKTWNKFEKRDDIFNIDDMEKNYSNLLLAEKLLPKKDTNIYYGLMLDFRYCLIKRTIHFISNCRENRRNIIVQNKKKRFKKKIPRKKLANI